MRTFPTLDNFSPREFTHNDFAQDNFEVEQPMTPDPESLPLRDRLSHAEKLVRELSDHIQVTYLSRVRDLESKTETGAPPVGDMTIRMGVARTIEADDAALKLWKTLRVYLKSVTDDVERIIREGD